MVVYATEIMKQSPKILVFLFKILDETQLNSIFEEYGFNIKILQESDTNHPVDNFNLVKRISLYWKDIQYKTKDNRIQMILGKAVFLIMTFLDILYNNW